MQPAQPVQGATFDLGGYSQVREGTNGINQAHPQNKTSSEGKKKKEVLLKHLSVSEKQKLANMVLTIHQLTEQKLFYESKYSSLLPKLKQMMEKFEERSRRLSQYQNAMKKLKSELDQWKEKSVLLSDQVRNAENEKNGWRQKYEELERRMLSLEEEKLKRESRSVQVFQESTSISTQTDEPQQPLSSGFSSQEKKSHENRSDDYREHDHQILRVSKEKFPQASSSRLSFPNNNSPSLLKSSYMIDRNTIPVTNNTNASSFQPSRSYPAPHHDDRRIHQSSPGLDDSMRRDTDGDNLSDIFNSDTESLYSIRQREVDALLQRSEAVLNRSRVSRPSTPDSIEESRRKRQELLRKSSGLHQISSVNQEYSSLLVQTNAQRPLPYTQQDILHSEILLQRNRAQGETQTLHNQMESQRRDANDLFHFVDILEQNLDITIEQPKGSGTGEHSHNPLIGSHISFTDIDQNASFSTTTSHQHNSEAWFDMADTFQENDIFDIIS